MLSQSVIISLIVFAIWYTMQEGEIFGKIGDWFGKNLPSAIHDPVFDCPVCMVPYYGSVIYILVWGVNWQWPVVVLTAMGFNAVMVRLWPEK